MEQAGIPKFIHQIGFDLCIKSFIQNKIFLLLSLLLIGCQSNQSNKTQPKENAIPVIDILDSHPKKEIILQDIAEIEYVPLETTDSVLLGRGAILSSVSDKYILVRDFYEGGIFVLINLFIYKYQL